MKDETEAGGESVAEAAEEVWAGWAARGSGHGLEVGPSGLLDEAVANGDMVGRAGGGGGGINGGGGGRKHVFKGSVGEEGRFDRDKLQVEERWQRVRVSGGGGCGGAV